MSQAAAKTSIHVTPNAGGFGAAISGVDLTRQLELYAGITH